MGDQSATDLIVGAGDELHQVPRHTGAPELLRQLVRDRTDLGCRLQNHCVASGQRGTDATRRNRVWEVPRRGNQHDPVGQERESGRDPFLDRLSAPSVVASEVDCLRDLRIALLNRLAGSARHQRQRASAAVFHFVGDRRQHGAARGKRNGRPPRGGINRGCDDSINLFDGVDDREVRHFASRHLHSNPGAIRCLGPVGIRAVFELVDVADWLRHRPILRPATRRYHRADRTHCGLEASTLIVPFHGPRLQREQCAQEVVG